MGMSQMFTGAGDYFRTSKPHSEKLCGVTLGTIITDIGGHCAVRISNLGLGGNNKTKEIT